MIFVSKAFLLFNVAALIATDLTFGQKASKPQKVKVYDAILDLSTQQNRGVGILKEVRDSAIVLTVGPEDVTVYVKNINRISIKRKGSVGNGARTGMFVGAVVGGVIGYASANGDSCDGFCMSYETGTNTVFCAMIGGGIGAFIGMIAGRSLIEKFEINGSQLYFKSCAPSLRAYSLSQSD